MFVSILLILIAVDGIWHDHLMLELWLWYLLIVYDVLMEALLCALSITLLIVGFVLTITIRHIPDEQPG